MKFNDVVKKCHDVVSKKGFNFNQHTLQELLTASEVAEAMECIDLKDSSDEIKQFAELFQEIMYEFEVLRQTIKVKDKSVIADKEHYAEEKADQVIRIFTKCYANNIDILEEIKKKLEKNEKRPHLHGKNF